MLPMRLASEKLMWIPPTERTASISAMTWSTLLVRGTRPSVMMMSQNSHLKGQPRVVCRK